ncbi:hypothetical protein BJ912DRAFT_860648, partial [Pholiota molesta]
LAYVDWFTPFTRAHFDCSTKMFRIARLMNGGDRVASIVPLATIRASVQLLPKFGPVAAADWRSSSVLDVSPYFYVNPFSDRFVYATVF